ncbi:Glycine-zipper containing OmpA-like membrane domain-containing protein [Desulfuromusa kysingii]|uniref:Glycine-zipper containing OmpA-like membrane domain-containing protein n=1 Tax=Desulfuromusa kysingii TaxID=37625 RepID=A0A1H4EJT6_9BACT|nr:glycine zipper 2TM domain-containing protein [Desulfuromusa kysingii]SEA85206.1 Glycine-zipper containing OmpA-like membrane domain-containing protein [Desulfuromusa kysingii]
MTMTTTMDRFNRAVQSVLLGLLLIGVLLISSCAPRMHTKTVQASETIEASPSRSIYFYPTQGQSQVVQDRDRYECSLWAVQQSGFDPSSTELAPHQRIVVETRLPQGHNTLLGAASGAVIGAAVSSPHHGPGAAVLGAVVGAVIGAASDASEKEQADAIQESYDQQDARKSAVIERQAGDYRRALMACMEGRGYSVQ